MTVRPILFSAPMVRALLADTKTQTRRLIPDQTLYRDSAEAKAAGERGEVWTGFMGWQFISTALANRGMCGKGCLPRISVGDILYVREAIWCSGAMIQYQADRKTSRLIWPAQWKREQAPAMHMPRAASRLTLKVTEVRVERLQDISEVDALAEGITSESAIVGSHGAGGRHHEIFSERFFFDGCEDEGFEDGVEAYAALWNHINGAGAWEANPWVSATTFEVHRENVDAYLERVAA